MLDTPWNHRARSVTMVSCCAVLSLTGCPDTAPKVRISEGPGVVTTLAGSSQGYSEGVGADARFNEPEDLAVAADGTVYVADTSNHRVRVIRPNGQVSTLAGSERGFADGTAQEAKFDQPRGIALDSQGNVFVADSNNHRIRKVTPEGAVSTVAGNGSNAFNDGTGEQAQFWSPQRLAFQRGELYVSDTGNLRVRRISPEGMVSTYAGSGHLGMEDGARLDATFLAPAGLAFDAVGTFAGTSDYRGATMWPTGGYVDGPAATARFAMPGDLAVDARGTLYVADWGNHVIRKVTPDGEVSSLAGGLPESPDQGQGTADGTGSAARFRLPRGIALGADGSLYVADTGNHRVRRIQLP